METIPPNESIYGPLWLNALNRLHEMEGKWQNDLYEIVTLASEMCETSAAVLHPATWDGQVCFAKPGVALNGVENKLFALARPSQTGVFVVEDTLAPGTPANAAPAFRFYAGIAITGEGANNLGYLFVLDINPGKLTPRQDICLRMLAKQAARVLELSGSLKIVSDLITKFQQSDVRLRAFFDSTSSNNLLLGKNFELLYFNRAVAEFLHSQFGRYPALEEDYRQYIPAASIKIFTECFTKALHGERSQGERIIQYSGMPAFWWEIIYSPARDSHGNIIGVSLYAKNIDERKLFEEKIKAQNLQLKKIAQLQSHQVRGPLTAVMGLMAILKEDPLNTNQYLQLMDVAIKQLDDNIHSVVAQTINV